ncbi:MAG: sodium:proton antiporter [Dehalococcoidia bacterium]|nr:sodium:proton antiporter [Dehalococcoidia bacterium]
MMSKIVRTMTRLLTPAILLFGLYIIMHGHITPGGGFQGGAVFASAIALLIVAFGSSRVEEYLKEHSLSVVESSGAVLFIGLAFAGMATAFFANFLVGSPLFGHVPAFGPNPGDLWTGGTIPLMNVAVGMKVIAGLSAIMLLMALAASKAGERK